PRDLAEHRAPPSTRAPLTAHTSRVARPRDGALRFMRPQRRRGRATAPCGGLLRLRAKRPARRAEGAFRTASDARLLRSSFKGMIVVMGNLRRVAVVLALALVLPVQAAAQSPTVTPEAERTSKARFDEGRALLAAGRPAEA